MDEIVCVSDVGCPYEISSSLHPKIAVMSDGTILINENYKDDPEIINELVKFKFTLNDVGEKFTDESKIKYVTSELVSAKYANASRVANQESQSSTQKKVSTLISRAFDAESSDIHIELLGDKTRIFFRILGDRIFQEELTYADGYQMCSVLYETMTATSATTFNPRDFQDAKMNTFSIDTALNGVRVATAPTEGGGFNMVLRLLPKKAEEENPSLAKYWENVKKLGYLPHQIKQIEQMLSVHTSGITLVSGPTGSGKSTTLEALIKVILFENKGKINFLTIEDPAEFEIYANDKIIVDGKEKKEYYRANQISIPSVSDKAEKSKMYNDAITAGMRLDIDYVMIGEIRDLATVEAAIKISNSGHPVYSTVHAGNVHSMLDRLIILGASERLLLSKDQINGLFAQRLIQVLCPHCKLHLNDNLPNLANLLKDEIKEVEEIPQLIDSLLHVFDNDLSGIFITNPTGCDKCRHRGVVSREVVAEFIIPDEEYLELLRKHKHNQAHQYWIDQGGVSMMDVAIAKIKAGIFDPFTAATALTTLTRSKNTQKAIDDLLGVNHDQTT